MFPAIQISLKYIKVPKSLDPNVDPSLVPVYTVLSKRCDSFRLWLRNTDRSLYFNCWKTSLLGILVAERELSTAGRLLTVQYLVCFRFMFS
jgi:hypothetical protein